MVFLVVVESGLVDARGNGFVAEPCRGAAGRVEWRHGWGGAISGRCKCEKVDRSSPRDHPLVRSSRQSISRLNVCDEPYDYGYKCVHIMMVGNTQMTTKMHAQTT